MVCNDATTDFSDGWKVTGFRFPDLRQFCGDLASTFPNTATVEFDFSIIGWEKDEYHKSIIDYSQGVLHCKQFAALSTLKTSICCHS